MKFEYAIDVLKYDIQCIEENDCAGLVKLNFESKANLKELQQAIEILEKAGEE